MGCAASDGNRRCLFDGLVEEEVRDPHADDPLQVCDTASVTCGDRAKALQIDPQLSFGAQLSTHMPNTTMALDAAAESSIGGLGMGGSGTWLGSKVSSVLLSKLATRMTRMSIAARNSKEHMVTTIDPRDIQELRDEMFSSQLDESIADMLAAASAALDRDESEGPLGAAERSPRRCYRQKLRFIQTLGRIASARMQLIIENPRRIEECYDLGEQIGKGGFGSVLKATVKATKATRAVKAMLKERVQANMDFLKKEIEITKMVDHPNIIKLYEIFEDEDTIYFVMELCSGGPLLDRIKQTRRLTEKQSAIVMLQIFRAVSYLHKNAITHRDLKSENCLLSTNQPIENNSIKVTDFGLSCYFHPCQMLTSRVGTPSYMAPEVYAKCYDESCDLWSCGVMMYSILVGYLPFCSKDDKELRGKIMAGKYKFRPHDWCSISPSCMELIQNLLVVDTRLRFTAKEALNHEWIKTMAPLPDVALQQDLLEHLSSFRTQNKFKKAALHIVASLLREEQLSEYIKAWISVDVDGDGTLSPVELRERLKNSSLATLYDSVDEIFHDETGQTEDLVEYTYTEFLAATFDKRKYIAEDVCRAAFSVFDQNGDGTLSKEELRTGYMFGSLQPEELKRLVNDLDDNGDGEIDFHEFMHMMITGNTKRHPKPGEELKQAGKLGRSLSLPTAAQQAKGPDSAALVGQALRPAQPVRPSSKVVRGRDSVVASPTKSNQTAGSAPRSASRGRPPSKDSAPVAAPRAASKDADSPRPAGASERPSVAAKPAAAAAASPAPAMAAPPIRRANSEKGTGAAGGAAGAAATGAAAGQAAANTVRRANSHQGSGAVPGTGIGSSASRSATPAAERAKKERGSGSNKGAQSSAPAATPSAAAAAASSGAKKQPQSATSPAKQPPKSSKSPGPTAAGNSAAVAAAAPTGSREKAPPSPAAADKPKGGPAASIAAASTSVGASAGQATTKSRAASSSPSPAARTAKRKT